MGIIQSCDLLDHADTITARAGQSVFFHGQEVRFLDMFFFHRVLVSAVI